MSGVPVEVSENLALEGNVLASGDDAEDRAAEEDVRVELEAGNPWAWCCVRVSVGWGELVGDDYLGGCSYASEEDFRVGGYYADMCAEARRQLLEQLRDAQVDATPEEWARAIEG
jgi:hypothetical protein